MYLSLKTYICFRIELKNKFASSNGLIFEHFNETKIQNDENNF